MSALTPATPELIALLCASRKGDPLWREDYVYGVIQQAMRGDPPMTWEQVAVGMVRLMADPAAVPRDLLPDSRSPVHRRRALEAGHNAAAAAEVRAEMEAALRREGAA